MQQVKYGVNDAQASLEFILEQVTHGTEVVIVRHGIEIARITPVEGLANRGITPMNVPYELR